jgi:hypothetical protein
MDEEEAVPITDGNDIEMEDAQVPPPPKYEVTSMTYATAVNRN